MEEGCMMKIFKKAILIIHGFAGTTKDEEPLYYELNRSCRYDVYNFVLPGHDRVTYIVSKDDWIKSAEEHLEKLISYGYKKIYVIGHSMGGVLATHLAVKYPKYVKKLVLLAPAFDYLSKDESKFKKLINGGIKVFKDFSSGEIFGRWLKMTPLMLSSFLKLVESSKDLIVDVKCPILIMHGNNDAIVPYQSSERIYEIATTKRKRLIELDNINHEVFDGQMDDEIITEVKHFLKNSYYKKNTISKMKYFLSIDE